MNTRAGGRAVKKKIYRVSPEMTLASYFLRRRRNKVLKEKGLGFHSLQGRAVGFLQPFPRMGANCWAGRGVLMMVGLSDMSQPEETKKGPWFLSP